MFHITVIFTLTVQRFFLNKKCWKNKETFINVYYNYGCRCRRSHLTSSNCHNAILTRGQGDVEYFIYTVSSALYSTVTLTFDLLNPTCEAFVMHRWCMFCENLSNTVQDYRVNNIQGRTHGHTGEQDKKTLCLRPRYVGRRHNERRTVRMLGSKGQRSRSQWNTMRWKRYIKYSTSPWPRVRMALWQFAPYKCH